MGLKKARQHRIHSFKVLLQNEATQKPDYFSKTTDEGQIPLHFEATLVSTGS